MELRSNEGKMDRYIQPPPNVFKYPSIAKGKGNGRDWSTGTNDEWTIEEKIDGSQLSFQTDDGLKVHFYNRGNEKFPPYDPLFERSIKAIQTFVSKLQIGCIYHGEIICRPRHNVILYERVPRFNFIMFDFQNTEHEYQSSRIMAEEANRIGFEHTQILWDNGTSLNDNNNLPITPTQKIDELMKAIEEGKLKSCLGGRPEGVVLKHPRYVKEFTTPDGEVKSKMAATKMKSVCKIFKEQHHVKKEKLPQLEPNDVINQIMSWYPQEAWWRKAYQRLRDNEVIHEGDDKLQRDKDGAKISEEVRRDFLEENEEQLKELLFAAFSMDIAKGVSTGASQWYRGPSPDDPDYDPNWADKYDVKQPWMK